MNPKTLPLAKPNFIVLGICLVPLTLFIIAFLIPVITQNWRQDINIPAEKERLKDLKANIETQKQLEHYLTKLRSTPLTKPQKTKPLNTEQAEKILTDLQESARLAGVQALEIRPLFDETGKQAEKLSIEAVFKGNFTNLYTVLMNLLQLEYMDRIISMTFEAESRKVRLHLIFAVHMN